jgi:hypothetical protein
MNWYASRHWRHPVHPQYRVSPCPPMMKDSEPVWRCVLTRVAWFVLIVAAFTIIAAVLVGCETPLKTLAPAP